MQTEKSEQITVNRAPGVRTVEMDRPWSWLATGWRDFARAPLVSLSYGFLFSLAGYVAIYGLYAIDSFI